MAVSNYSNLKTAVGDWLGRSDLGSPIDDFIDLAEARIYGELRMGWMDAQTTLSFSAGTRSVTLPTDFLEARQVMLNTNPLQVLEAKSGVWGRSVYPDTGAQDRPLYYSVTGSHGGGYRLDVHPSPDSAYDVLVKYYAKPTALSTSNETNWITDNAPDLILFGALVESAPYIGDDPRAVLWEARFQRALDRTRLLERSLQYGRNQPLAVTPL